MYCFKCGAELNENARFCSKCGTGVNIQPPVIAPVNNPSKPQSNAFTYVSVAIMGVMSLLFFWITDYAISFATSTIVPVLMLILAVANLIFFMISRKADK